MKILIACEYSQIVTKEFRSNGHEAYSCDILPTEGTPDWHIQSDVLEQLNAGWDCMIAFPPCTYITNAGARHLYPKGVLNEDRLKLGMEAKEFFMQFYNANCDKIVIENPLPSKIYGLPKHSQVIQPWQFGHPFKKERSFGSKVWIIWNLRR